MRLCQVMPAALRCVCSTATRFSRCHQLPSCSMRTTALCAISTGHTSLLGPPCSVTQGLDGQSAMLHLRSLPHLHDLGLFDNALALLVLFPLLHRMLLQTATAAGSVSGILSSSMAACCRQVVSELGQRQRAHVFPAEHGVAGGAVDVGHSVTAGDEQSILLGAPCHIDAADQGRASMIAQWVKEASPASVQTSSEGFGVRSMT